MPLIFAKSPFMIHTGLAQACYCKVEFGILCGVDIDSHLHTQGCQTGRLEALQMMRYSVEYIHYMILYIIC